MPTARRSTRRLAAAAGAYAAAIAVAPARAGVNAITVRLTRAADDTPVDVIELRVALAQPALGVEPVARRLARAAPGVYRLDGPALSVPGTWTLTVEALITDFAKVTFQMQIAIR